MLKRFDLCSEAFQLLGSFRLRVSSGNSSALRRRQAAKNDLIRKFQSTAPWVIFKPAMLFSCYYSMLLRRFS